MLARDVEHIPPKHFAYSCVVEITDCVHLYENYPSVFDQK